MTGTEDEASAQAWPDELNDCARKPSNLRRICILAAIAAAIFIFDVSLSDTHVFSSIFRHSFSSLGTFLATLCVLAGLYYLASAGIRFLFASLVPKETPEYRQKCRRALMHLLTGFGGVVLPLVLSAYNWGYNYGYNYYGYNETRSVDSMCAILLILCGYATFVCLIHADMLLSEIARSGDEEAKMVLKEKMAGYILAIFVLMLVPAAYGVWCGS